MANLILPDSNVYIDAVRAKTDPFRQFAPFTNEWEFATCGVVVLEVCRGLRDQGVLQRFRDQFAAMIYLPTSNSMWERAAQLAWMLDRRGEVLPASDLIIAACALYADATVLTADAHFSRIPGLRILDRLD
jgi:predicted nucleic acid-binding protein